MDRSNSARPGLTDERSDSEPSETDSLFDDDGRSSVASARGVEGTGGGSPHADVGTVRVASREPPPIPGLYVFPDILPREVATIADADHFGGGERDQAMLFAAAPDDGAGSVLPAHIRALDNALAALLAPRLPTEVHTLAFGQRQLARQAILNLYVPGRGIAPHVDLPRRYADGIVGTALAGGCVMTFRHDPSAWETGYPAPEAGGHGGERVGKREGGTRYDVYLPPRSVYVMTGPARWAWTHGIAYRDADVVRGAVGPEGGAPGTQTLPRALRVSVTFRWMKEGAGLLA